jgi:hypothetical protein
VVLAGEDLPLEQVHRLGEPGRLEQTTVIGVVSVLEELRAQLVPLDEETALVVGGEVHRADHPVAPAPGQPGLGRIEQRSRDLGVVRALEEAEQPPLVSLELVQALVDVGADPADRLIAPPGEEYSAWACSKNGFLPRSRWRLRSEISDGTQFGAPA